MITTIFFDIGGVLLTDGWGHESRRIAADKFGLDWEEYSDRHEKLAHAIEVNRLTLERYLDRAIFFRPRLFSREEFRKFIFDQSQPHPESLKLVEELSRSGRYLLATLNNEIMELNSFRIEKFGLTRYFPVFFSSCFLGLRKPDDAIYRAVMQMTQRVPEQCIFVDDREVNLECPREMGIDTILFKDAAQLRADLIARGIGMSDVAGA